MTLELAPSRKRTGLNSMTLAGKKIHIDHRRTPQATQYLHRTDEERQRQRMTQPGSDVLRRARMDNDIPLTHSTDKAPYTTNDGPRPNLRATSWPRRTLPLKPRTHRKDSRPQQVYTDATKIPPCRPRGGKQGLCFILTIAADPNNKRTVLSLQ